VILYSYRHPLQVIALQALSIAALCSAGGSVSAKPPFHKNLGSLLFMSTIAPTRKHHSKAPSTSVTDIGASTSSVRGGGSEDIE
jgi:hypothetical protein